MTIGNVRKDNNKSHNGETHREPMSDVPVDIITFRFLFVPDESTHRVGTSFSLPAA